MPYFGMFKKKYWKSTNIRDSRKSIIIQSFRLLTKLSLYDLKKYEEKEIDFSLNISEVEADKADNDGPNGIQEINKIIKLKESGLIAVAVINKTSNMLVIKKYAPPCKNQNR